MLMAGEVDAAMWAAASHRTRGFSPSFFIPGGGGWRRKNNALQINHMVVVKDSFSRSHRGAVTEICRMLCESKKAAPVPTG